MREGAAMASGPVPGANGPRLGQVVVDRAGVTVGRIDQIHHGLPLAVADDGRRIGEALDLVALLPGRFRRQLPLLSPAVAARLVREGYLRTHRPAGDRSVRYVAISEIEDVTDGVVRLRVDVEQLPTIA